MLTGNKSKFTIAGIVLVPIFLYLASIWRRPLFAPLEYNCAAVADTLSNFLNNGSSLLVPKVADAILVDYPIFSYYLPAFLQSVLGKSAGSIRLGFVIVILLTALVLWKGTKGLISKETSVVSCCLFITMFMPFLAATFANSGAWGCLFTLLGTIFLSKGASGNVRNKTSNSYFFLTGLMASLGLLFYGVEIPVILILSGIIGFLLLKKNDKLLSFILFGVLGLLPLSVLFMLILKNYEPSYLPLFFSKYNEIRIDLSIFTKLGNFILGTLPPGLFIFLVIKGYKNKVKEFFLNPSILMLAVGAVVALVVGLLSPIDLPFSLILVYPLMAIFMAQGLVYFSASSVNIPYCNRVIKKIMVIFAVMIFSFFIYHVLGIFFNIVPQRNLIFSRGEAYYLPILVSLVFLFWLYFAYTEENYTSKFGCIILGCFCLFSMFHSFIPLRVVINYAPIRFLEKSLEPNLEAGNIIFADKHLLGAAYWHLPKYTVKFIGCNKTLSLDSKDCLNLNILEESVKTTSVPVWLLSKKDNDYLANKKITSLTEVIALHNKVFSAKLYAQKSSLRKSPRVKVVKKQINKKL